MLDLDFHRYNRQEHNNLRKDFCCGKSRIDNWFRNNLTQDEKDRSASTYLALNQKDNKLTGFYTLSSCMIQAKKVQGFLNSKYEEIPGTLIGRFGTAKQYTNKCGGEGGVGSLMMANIIMRVVKQNKEGSASAFLILEPLNEKEDTLDKNNELVSYYERYGFSVVEGTNYMIRRITDDDQKRVEREQAAKYMKVICRYV